jgi:hypothetical protein
MNAEAHWFGVRCLFRHFNLVAEDGSTFQTYEERVVVVRALDFDWAIKKAEREAVQYAHGCGACEYLGFANCFDMRESEIVDFTEVYSLMRKSTLAPEDYIDRFYDTGDECTH